MRCYLPQIYEYSMTLPSIRMEYYEYPTISDLYLYGGHALGIWNHIFNALFQVVHEMREIPLSDSEVNVRRALASMYMEKTLQRLDELKVSGRFTDFFSHPVFINGREYPSIDQQLEGLLGLAEHHLVERNSGLSLMHGDLCIANILFDPRSRVLKMIDPRGQFGDYSVFGDYRYDLAKLSHSFNGHYESIINDAFSIEIRGGEINYTLPLRHDQQIITGMFNKRLAKEFPGEKDQIDLIEALLFLTMVPLHKDHLPRQAIMLSLALEKLHRACSAFGGEKNVPGHPVQPFSPESRVLL